MATLDQAAAPVAPSPGIVTQTIVTGTGGVLLAANPLRKWARWMVIGAADITVAPGTAAPAVGQGMIYQCGSAAGKQGSSESLSDLGVATNAFAYAAATATTIVVWECQ